MTKEAKAEGESDTAANAETESAAASSAAGQTSASTPVGVNSQKAPVTHIPPKAHIQ